MNYIEKLQSLSKEDATKVIQVRLSSLAIDALASMKEESLTEGKVDGAYSHKNPKIDLFIDGEYRTSTNWSSTINHAIKSLKDKNPDIKDKKITAIFSNKKYKNEAIQETEEYQDENLVSEGTKKVGDYANGRHSATVHRDSELKEYKVKFFKDGKHHEPADYYCDDKDDAMGTAKRQCDAAHAKDKASKE